MDTTARSVQPAPVDLAPAVSALARGDRAALSGIFEACSDRVYAIALRLLRLPQDAEEVVVDVFQQVWQEASRFDPGRGSVEAWVARIAHSRAIDRLRRRTARPDQDAGVHPELVEGAYTEREDESLALIALYEEGSQVRRALNVLSAEQRRCIGLAFMEGLSHPEIAQRLNLPLGTVKSHVRRGMQALRAQLEAWGYQHEPD